MNKLDSFVEYRVVIVKFCSWGTPSKYDHHLTFICFCGKHQNHFHNPDQDLTFPYKLKCYYCKQKLIMKSNKVYKDE